MKPLTPLRAIRQHCLSCAGRPKDVRACSNTECYLYRFRMGKNPARTKIGPGMVIKIDPTLKTGDSTQVSEKISAKECLAMSKGIAQPGASGEEIRPILEGQGKIQICRTEKEISIKVITEN